MRGIKLLAASADGGNVSPDGCHTPVVKEFWTGVKSCIIIMSLEI